MASEKKHQPGAPLSDHTGDAPLVRGRVPRHLMIENLMMSFLFCLDEGNQIYEDRWDRGKAGRGEERLTGGVGRSRGRPANLHALPRSTESARREVKTGDLRAPLYKKSWQARPRMRGIAVSVLQGF